MADPTNTGSTVQAGVPVTEKLVTEDGEVVTVERDPQQRSAPTQAAEELEEEHTKEELYEEAQELDVEGRSKMDKEELAEAVAEEPDEVPGRGRRRG